MTGDRIAALEARVAKLEAAERWRQIRSDPNSPMARTYQHGHYDPDIGPFEGDPCDSDPKPSS